MTLDRIRLPRNSAAPEEGWRITTMSIRIASRFRAVSTRVSPFCTELPLAATLTVSAERRFSANSNEIRVRVDASRSEEHTAELQSPCNIVCRLLLEKKKKC